jgi:Tol biopolymer transport system component
LGALVALSVGIRQLNSPQASSDEPPAEPRTIARLTNTGSSAGPAISPDGKFVAYVQSAVGEESLRLRLVSTGRDVEIVPPATDEIQGITFSPDGNWIYYARGTTLYEVSMLGGRSRSVLSDVDGPVTIAPGGSRFAFIRDDLTASTSAVMLAGADGASTTTLATRTLPEYFRSAAWAPRADVIVASAGTRAGERSMTLTEIAVATGAERALTSYRWYATRQVAWLSDETGLILSASAQPSAPFQLWHVSYPAGLVTRITNDLDDYFSPALTADAAHLVSTRRSALSDIWVAPGAGHSVRVTPEAARAERPSWTPDGEIVYEARTSGNRDLWIMGSDGSHKRQLTRDPAPDHSPSASPGGDRVYFVSERTGIPHIWSIRTDGTDATQLTHGQGEVAPDCSPDGGWIVYEAVGSGRPLLWRVPAAGGAAVQLTDRLSRSPAISPDGQLIALYYWDEVPESPIRLAVIPASGGTPVKLFDFHDDVPSRFLRWSADGRAVTYVVTRSGVSNIWSQALEGGPPRPVTRFVADGMTFFDWSPSGEQLAFTRRIQHEDVVLINAFR